jgi:rare lipoprotein A (peptidoglycan hydrolase)
MFGQLVRKKEVENPPVPDPLVILPSDKRGWGFKIRIRMMKKILCLALFTGCLQTLLAQDQSSSPKDTTSRSDTSRTNYTKTGKSLSGLAAIYPADMDGSITATGETFLHIRLTAASNDFSLNSWVLVTHPKTKKSVIVRINDRIPAAQRKKGTVITLSNESAKTIGIKQSNSIKVKIESIQPSDSLSFVQTIPDSIPKKDSLTPNTFRPKGKAVNGIASYYSANLDGTLTATGERYRNAKLTAASNHFKLNTWVLVTNLSNQKSVIVRINDRMHPRMKKKGRVVDMSQEAARQLDYIEKGLTKVKVQPIEFYYSPEFKQELDSLKQQDSLAVADSLKINPPEENSRTGIASFYSRSFEGSKTATGEIYHNNRLSAASNDFDLHTWVRVTNLNNNKSVVLRINDRMHPKMQQKGRVIDLSRVAAHKLDMLRSGLANVKVEVVPAGTKQ